RVQLATHALGDQRVAMQRQVRAVIFDRIHREKNRRAGVERGAHGAVRDVEDGGHLLIQKFRRGAPSIEAFPLRSTFASWSTQATRRSRNNAHWPSCHDKNLGRDRLRSTTSVRRSPRV